MSKFPGESYDASIRRSVEEYYEGPEPCEICGDDKKQYRENEIDAARYRALRDYGITRSHVYLLTTTCSTPDLFDIMIDERFEVEY
jgi:hypothetical protein